MVLALFAMPALMRFVTPLVSSLSAGAGGALGAAAIMSLPSGAAAAGRLATGSGGGSSSAGGPGATGGQGSTGASGPSGSNGGGGSAPQAAQASSAAGGGGGGGGTTGAAASSGAAGGGTGAAAASAGGGAATVVEPLRVVELPRAALLPVVEQLPALRVARSAWPRASRSALRLRVCKRPRERRRTWAIKQRVKGTGADGNRRDKP